MKRIALFFLNVIFGFYAACAQQNAGVTDPLGFEEYDPVSTLKVEAHLLKRARYPFIDVHNHQPQMPTQDLPLLLSRMDSLHLRIMVNLSGRGWTQDWDEGTAHLKKALENVRKTDPRRLVVFPIVLFRGFGYNVWTE